MAGIDKMWGTQEEHDQLRAWIKRYRPRWRVHIYLNRDHLPPDEVRSIACFRVRQDRWLARKCRLPCVLRNLMSQYNEQNEIHHIARAALREKKDAD
jgi:hypothetical protein